MSAILIFDFQNKNKKKPKKKTKQKQNKNQLRFSEVNDPILHVTTIFSLKQGETRTSSGPIPHPLIASFTD